MEAVVVQSTHHVESELKVNKAQVMAGQAQVKAKIDSVEAEVRTQIIDAQGKVEASQCRRVEAQMGRSEDKQSEVMASIKAVKTEMETGQQEIKALLYEAVSSTDFKV